MMNRNGFTLVELSIVLVILGLLIGGVLTGQSLIRAAELRSVTTQEARYVTAVQTFRDKYFALPGDMTNATSYWGTEAQGCPGTVSTPSTTATTCNGDGNGQIAASTNSDEKYRFWQHLANAGLIEGSYVGVTQGTNGNSTTSTNAPAGRISGSQWHDQWIGALTSNTTAPDGQYDNVFQIGGLTANNAPITAFLKPEEAYNIDAKIDDGKPATGKLVTRNNAAWASQTCTDGTASTILTSNYLLSNSTIACSLYFRQVF